MVKYLLNFLFAFLILSSFAFARNDDIKLQNEYGPKLTQVPFFLRYSFLKKFHEDWKETTYSERKAFLMDYEKNLAIEQAQEKADAKAEADIEKERLKKKRDAERKESDRLKAEADEERDEERAEADRQRAFNQQLRSEQQELQQMQQGYDQSSHN